MEFNELIKSSREKMGMTQEGLAEALGVSNNTIQNWERGQNCPNINSLKGIVTVLHLKEKDLIKVIMEENTDANKPQIPASFKWASLLPTELDENELPNVNLRAETQDLLKIIRLHALFKANPIPELLKVQSDYDRLMSRIFYLAMNEVIFFEESSYGLTSFGRRIVKFLEANPNHLFDLYKLEFSEFLEVGSARYEKLAIFKEQIPVIQDLVSQQTIVLETYRWSEDDDSCWREREPYWKQVLYTNDNFVWRYEDKSTYHWYDNEEYQDHRIPLEYFEIIHREFDHPAYTAEKDAYLKKKEYYEAHCELIEGLAPPRSFDFLFEKIVIPTQKALDLVQALQSNLN